MKKIIIVCACALVLPFLLPPVSLSAADSVEIEQLLFLDIPNIVTASKKEEAVNKAPSVVYVVTADEIKRSGARTLADALKRVPGMRLGLRETTIIGSRGFTSDQIDKFVWMIDGAPVTNIMQDGPWGLLDIPDMDMVERIEIVKGPGSTLWGSNACLGIVNIITKDGEDIGGTIPSYSFSTRDEQGTANVLYGNKVNGLDYMFSFTFTQSKGFENSGSGYNRVFTWGTQTQNIGYDNYTLAGDRGRNTPLIDMQPSWELYGKIAKDGLRVKTRASYTRESYLWGSNLDAQLQDAVFKHTYLDIEKEHRLDDNSSLTNKLNIHSLAYERGVLVKAIDPLALTDVETKSEMGVNAESIYNTVIADKHNIVAGVRLASTEFGPSQRQQFVVGSGTSTQNSGYPVGFRYSYVTDAGRETASALYIEDSFSAADRLTLTAGAGYEYSEFIEPGGNFMPRAAVIYDLSDRWSVKSCYNTGYERPPVDKKFHKHFGHVDESETIEETDLQVSYRSPKTRASVTAYYYTVNNYFTWIQVNDAAGNIVLQGHENSGDAKSDGFEMDFRHNLTSSFSLSANFTYANTKINNASTSGDPSQFYNIGADYYATKNISVNLNVNGFIDMPNGYPNGGVWRGDGEEITDLSIVADNFLNRPVTLTLFARNLFDVKSHVTMTGWPGYTFAEAVSYGAKLAYKF